MMEARYSVEAKISQDPFFGITYDPYPSSPGDDDIIRRMCDASAVAGVGPMAGVAGAVALHVAERLISEGSSHAIVENGGDIAFYSPEPRLVGIFADHPVFRDLAFSVSSDDVVLADCCATALGNLVRDESHIQDAVRDIGSREGVSGCMACCGDKVAMFGSLPEIVPADCSELVYGEPGNR